MDSNHSRFPQTQLVGAERSSDQVIGPPSRGNGRGTGKSCSVQGSFPQARLWVHSPRGTFTQSTTDLMFHYSHWKVSLSTIPSEPPITGSTYTAAQVTSPNRAEKNCPTCYCHTFSLLSYCFVSVSTQLGVFSFETSQIKQEQKDF